MLIIKDILIGIYLAVSLAFLVISIISYARNRIRKLLLSSLIFSLMALHSALLIFSILLGFSAGPEVFHAALVSVLIVSLFSVMKIRYRVSE